MFLEMENFAVPKSLLGLWCEGEDLAFLVCKPMPFCLARLTEEFDSVLCKESKIWLDFSCDVF